MRLERCAVRLEAGPGPWARITSLYLLPSDTGFHEVSAITINSATINAGIATCKVRIECVYSTSEIPSCLSIKIAAQLMTVEFVMGGGGVKSVTAWINREISSPSSLMISWKAKINVRCLAKMKLKPLILIRYCIVGKVQ